METKHMDTDVLDIEEIKILGLSLILAADIFIYLSFVIIKCQFIK